MKKKPEKVVFTGESYGFCVEPNGNLTYEGGTIAVRPGEAKKIMAARDRWEKYKAAQLADQVEIDNLRKERDRLQLEASKLHTKINYYKWPRSREVSRDFEVFLRSELTVGFKADSVRIGCNSFPWAQVKRVFKLIEARSSRK